MNGFLSSPVEGLHLSLLSAQGPDSLLYQTEITTAYIFTHSNIAIDGVNHKQKNLNHKHIFFNGTIKK